MLARARRGCVASRGLSEAFVRLGREGRDPGAAERRRLAARRARSLRSRGSFVFGRRGRRLAAAAPPAVAARFARGGALPPRGRRRRADIAVAVADALSGGRSLRGALASAAPVEWRRGRARASRVAAELAAGAPTDDALEAMRAHRLAADRRDRGRCLLQRRAGGDLARLLRDSAARARGPGAARGRGAGRDRAGALHRPGRRAAAAGRRALAELASPGCSRACWPFLTAWLVGMARRSRSRRRFAIRRLARMRG